VPGEDEVEIALADLEDPLVEQVTNGDEKADRAAKEAPIAALVEFDADVTVQHEVEGPYGTAAGPCAVRGASEWHFAWGRTTRDASDLMVLFNPFPSDVVVDGSFVTADGVREPVAWQGLVVPSGRVVALEVGDDVTRREQVAASIRARSGSLIVERLHVLDGSVDEEHVELAPGVAAPSTTAEFRTDGLDEDATELVAVYNPGDETAEVDVQVSPEHHRSGAALPRPFHVVVRPRQTKLLELSDESRVDVDRDHVTDIESTNGVGVVAQHVIL
jgi:hypothetical protein